MRKKRKISNKMLRMLFKRNYKALSTIFVLLLVTIIMFDSFVVNAMDVVQTGTYSDTTLAEFYSMQTPYKQLTPDAMVASFTSAGFDSSTIRNSAGFGSTLNLENVYTNNASNHFVIPTAVEVSGVTIRGGANKHCFTFSPSTPYMNCYSYSIEGAGQFAIVSNGGNANRYYVSDQPFQILGACKTLYPTEFFVYQSVSSSSGDFYYYQVDTYENIVLTDIPVYLATTDGSSGFTMFSSDASQNDFSFTGDNFDFNYLMTEGDIMDPNAPVNPPESDIEKVSKSYMNFASTDSWTGDALTQMYHNINFNPNEYMKLHGEQFQIVIETSATYKGSDMQQVVSFTMPEETIKVDMLMAQSPRGTIVVPVDLHNMKDGNGTDIRQYILNTLHTATGTSEEYININVLGNIGQGIQDTVNKFTGLSFTPFTQTKVIVRNDYDGFVDEFKLMSKIYVRSAPPDYNYESDFNSSQYNLVSGNYDILQNGGANNLYPPSENPDSGGAPSVIPNNPTGGGSDITVNSGGISNVIKDLVGSVQAIIEKGAVQNTVSPQQTAYGGSIESGAVVVQTGGGGFQLSNQDWNEYGGLVEEMASDMTDLQGENGTMSFMGAIKNAYQCLPDKIWTLIFAGVSGAVVIALWKKGAHCH